MHLVNGEYCRPKEAQACLTIAIIYFDDFGTITLKYLFVYCRTRETVHKNRDSLSQI